MFWDGYSAAHNTHRHTHTNTNTHTHIHTYTHRPLGVAMGGSKVADKIGVLWALIKKVLGPKCF